jgi:nucleoside-diphosphate-sugar epimerase
MRVLVTGAAGEIGRAVVPLLAEQHDVRATDIVEAAPPCEFVRADLLAEGAAAELVQGVEAVLHLAALLVRDYTMRQYMDVNATATALLMSAAAAAGVNNFVYASTVWVTGHGPEEGVHPVTVETPPKAICAYGYSKYLGEVSGEYHAGNTDLRVQVLRLCGYDHCGEIAPSGMIEWRSVDWPTLVIAATRSQRFFDPVDMADAFDAALKLPGKFSRYIVGVDWPFEAGESEVVLGDSEEAWEARYPGAKRLFRALGINAPDLKYWYETRPFCEATRWQPRMTLPKLMNRYLAMHGDKI